MPNEITTLDAVMTVLSNAGHQRRGACEFCRWAAR